ncbi:MAG: hypothetical protein NTY38_32110, partial [Acidobacteria bacterium]|nr:hypothetical protein [Acidobacteriota bacterium]
MPKRPILLALFLAVSVLSAEQVEERSVAIAWMGGKPAGRIVVERGTLKSLRVAAGQGVAENSGSFQARQAGPFRLEALIAGNVEPYNVTATLVMVESAEAPFTFLLRDARRAYPIWLPGAGASVTEASDRRTTTEIALAIRARGLSSKLEAIAAAPE